jgi:hypothetical protein
MANQATILITEKFKKNYIWKNSSNQKSKLFDIYQHSRLLFRILRFQKNLFQLHEQTKYPNN